MQQQENSCCFHALCMGPLLAGVTVSERLDQLFFHYGGWSWFDCYSPFKSEARNDV